MPFWGCKVFLKGKTGKQSVDYFKSYPQVGGNFVDKDIFSKNVHKKYIFLVYYLTKATDKKDKTITLTFFGQRKVKTRRSIL